jgi:hypothetical protein
MERHSALLGPVFDDAGSGRVWIVVEVLHRCRPSTARWHENKRELGVSASALKIRQTFEMPIVHCWPAFPPAGVPAWLGSLDLAQPSLGLTGATPTPCMS